MTRVAGALVVAALALSACGYAPLRAASGARLGVVAAPALVSDASVVAEAVAGARAAGARSATTAWLMERAPHWVVVLVTALLVEGE